MNRECPTRLWLSTLLIFWAWGLSCAPTGEPGFRGCSSR